MTEGTQMTWMQCLNAVMGTHRAFLGLVLQAGTLSCKPQETPHLENLRDKKLFLKQHILLGMTVLTLDQDSSGQRLFSPCAHPALRMKSGSLRPIVTATQSGGQSPPLPGPQGQLSTSGAWSAFLALSLTLAAGLLHDLQVATLRHTDSTPEMHT